MKYFFPQRNKNDEDQLRFYISSLISLRARCYELVKLSIKAIMIAVIIAWIDRHQIDAFIHKTN